ncbi:MAG TPA: response regulator [Polyangiaceae bacterium]|nr:response regulator [Polyangiaceae bacterium]
MTDAIAAGKAKILVADDNEANRALVQNTLEDEGHRVILANDGAQAIDAFQREAPDCVILDVRMPGIDGFAACEKIRALPNGAEVPAIFLTALRDVDTFDRALEVGGDDFLTKPVRPAELVARVETALKLRRMRAELREHYDLLKQQRDALLRVQLQKERLMAFVVHDLKNPVGTMDLHAQLLLRDPKLSESSRESATQIRNEARQLSRLILNLLDLAKGDEGKLFAKRTQVALKVLVDGLLAELAVTAAARDIHLEAILTAEHVYADPDLLRRLLVNLLDNAMRHTPPETTVSVTATTTSEGVEVAVRDQGPGVPSELRDRIFDPFVQAERSQNDLSRAGRGLGLAFCRLAVEAHGGRIWIEDGSPGAIFKMVLPRER